MSSISWRARLLRRTVGAFLSEPGTPVAEQREKMARADRFPMPRGFRFTDTTLGGRPAQVVEPKSASTDRHLLYLHGGGYVLAGSKAHVAMVARVCRHAQASASLVDYRLAPEHPYPAAVDDCVAAYRELASRVEPSRITIGGDSAGGGATIATLCALRDAGDPLPGAAWVLSPWTDLSASGASVTDRADADPMLRSGMLGEMAAHYAADTALDDPGVSPLFADLAGLPPTLIQVGDDEILLSDSTRLAERMRSAGSPVDLDVRSGMWHVYQLFAGMMPEATQAVIEAAAFIRWKTA